MSLPSDNQYPRIGVGVIILKGKKVLLGQRKGNRSPGYFGLPGGYLEKGESFEDCAKRELLEETGLTDMLLRPIYLIGGSSDNIHYADIVFYANYKNGEPIVRETNRVEKWEWFNILSLPAPLYKPTELALKHFISNYYLHKLKLFFQRSLLGKQATILYIDSINTEERQSEVV